jgi:hypothetical protein
LGLAAVLTSLWASPQIEHARLPSVLRKAFLPVTRRGQPLIDAIESYRTDNGAYPESLDQLVPEYLESIPDTGLAMYPEFEYECYPPSGEYEITVDTSHGGWDWDKFFYLSNGEYVEEYYNGTLIRVGSWAFLR